MLRAVNLTRSFGNRKVLRGLSLTIEPGEIVTLIGVNGAGKTTLLRVLADLIRPELGVIHFDDYTSRSEPATYRRNIGVVLHKPILYGNLTARENLLFFSRLYQVPNREARVHQVLTMVNLVSRANELVQAYSRGMQQRLAIARCLLHDPALLLLDEPHTGLDQGFSEVFENLIRGAADSGKMILLATHDLEKACLSGTRVDLLHGGKIAWSRPTEGLTSDSLREAYNEINGYPAKTRLDGGGV